MKKGGLEADLREGETDRERMVKTDSFVFLSLIRLILKIFQFVMKITMN